MNSPNITQATYTRMAERCESGEQQTNLDVSDLLEAYESAVLLLTKLADTGANCITQDVYDFLYTDHGDPRVAL